ncbi:disease resistance protein Pik-2 isoform X1 [Aegilops tauschii subsp. strangulata]|uniref:Disease resistance protein RPM1 n=4 Tax=Aegilops tauschii subsp. strangulata TaxID=200361 RepID=A0A453MS87_AEGTS|nr:disease resistance protein Pik-2 isoform X1 [Aegilops tauschii subsp. strangulata]XP_045085462.1 disease resistance protein Pik-2 isoform X1 [Aegilops tauschii subsp. strangulata]
MEPTAVSVGKAALGGALGYATSKAAEEIALQLGVERDVKFIRDELQMMQSFLMTADEEQSQNKVLTTWVQQIGVLAYKVEDSLMDFGLHSEKKPFLGCIPRRPGDRRRIAKEVKQLRAEVEDVSNRNLRYRLIKESSGSKPTTAEEQVSIANAAMFATVEKDSTSKVNLHQLVTSNDVNLRVISMWGTSGDLGKTSAIHEVYDDPMILKRFGFRAWIRLMHPFNPQEFLRGLLWQFYENYHDEVGKSEQGTSVVPNVLANMERMDQRDLVRMFSEQLCSNGYLVVINDLTTIEEWHCIKKYFPDNKKQSRIIVSTQQAEIASLCTEKPYQVSELKQLSCDQTIYLFHKKLQKSEEQVSVASVSLEMFNTDEARFPDVENEKLKGMRTSWSAELISDSNKVSTAEENTTMATDEIQEEPQESNNAGEDKVGNSTARKKFERSRTLGLADEVVCGRETEKSILIRLVGQPDNSQGSKVISVWGMGGLGKTTVVRSIYRSQQLGGWKRAWATALRPFNPEVLLRDLALQLQNAIQEDPVGSTATGVQKKNISVMKLQDLKDELARILKVQKCLLVLDDILSTSEWDLVKSCLHNAGRIIVTTRQKDVAKHCSRENKNMYYLEGLKDDAALDLFMKKVFKDNIKKIDLVPAMMEQARLILHKCDGLPLAISTIGGFLASKPKTAIEWRKMNDRIGTELEINPELRTIKTILMRSYDGLPYHLKSAFLYLSIFQEDQRIRWGCLVRRWTAEGYSRDMHGMTAIELCRRYFDELLERSMILPGEGTDQYSHKINSCQLHDMIREICISKAREENLVLTLEEGCCLSDTQGAIRHLVIGSNWKRDKDVLESKLDLSHIRSLTIFGEWRSFFISDNMRFLRVLDLEDTLELKDHHLDDIGQLRHLKYLSLRGCRNILYLPKSLQNLRHLEMLDLRGTCIYELPTTITNLQKLQHLRGDSLVLRPQVLDAGLNRYDIFNLYRFQKMKLDGVIQGVGKLKALHTLGGVDVSGRNGNVTVKELGELTQLHKLKVGGLSYRNINELWSAIAGHDQLQSLSVKIIGGWHEENNVLDGCLGDGLLPPSSLESLTLLGKLVNVTKWIRTLQNLSKLVLTYSRLKQDDAIQALGFLPNLAVLRLRMDSFWGAQLHFHSSSFPSLMVLELCWLHNLQSVLFEKDAMPKLEVLQIGQCKNLNGFSGLPALGSLKEIRLGSYELSETLKASVQSQVAEDMKHVRVNIF